MFLATSHQKTDVPLMTWGEALRDQLRAKWWVLILAGLEVIRQIHNIISEHSQRYNQFWQKKVFGGWERRMSRMKPYSRFRWSRLVKRLMFLAVRRPLPLVAVGPRTVAGARRGAEQDLPQRLPQPGGRPADRSDHRPQHARRAGVHRLLLRHLLHRRRRHVQARRHQDPVQRHLGSGPRRAAGQGEPRLPREAARRSKSVAATCRVASCCGARRAPARR